MQALVNDLEFPVIEPDSLALRAPVQREAGRVVQGEREQANAAVRAAFPRSRLRLVCLRLEPLLDLLQQAILPTGSGCQLASVKPDATAVLTPLDRNAAEARLPQCRPTVWTASHGDRLQ